MRLDYSLGRGGCVTSWDYPSRPLAGSGQVRFTCPPLALAGPDSTRRYQGPLAVFLRLCAVEPAKDVVLRQPLSNACATLIEIV